MRKFKIIDHISLDGVIQAPGGPEEGYEYGGAMLNVYRPVGPLQTGAFADATE